jgi:hypothetical protein
VAAGGVHEFTGGSDGGVLGSAGGPNIPDRALRRSSVAGGGATSGVIQSWAGAGVSDPAFHCGATSETGACSSGVAVVQSGSGAVRSGVIQSCERAVSAVDASEGGAKSFAASDVGGYVSPEGSRVDASGAYVDVGGS